MYFINRAQAGRKLAKELMEYGRHNVAVVALSPGSVIVGAQIAMRLHANLSLLMTENIFLPGEPEAIAALTSANTFTYNNMFSTGELEELTSEYRSYIDEQRREKMHRMNLLLSHDGEIKKDKLRRHVVIIVSDGLATGFSLDIAAEYLKTVALKKLIVATPFASVEAVDKMHLLGDEIVCLDVKENYINTNHYYDDNTIPPVEDLFRVMRNISLNWSLENA